MKHRLKLLFVSLLFFFQSNAQDSLAKKRVSLLTCSAGTEVYTMFGHSALRIIDSTENTDIVYNYGTFDFDESYIKKFLTGELKYYLEAEPFQRFILEYLHDRRGVSEQIIKLSPQQTNELIAFLHKNILPENKYYRYQVISDNCTTRIRDIFAEIYSQAYFHYPNITPQNTTFRQLINGCLEEGNWQWTKLGINIILGKTNDTIVSKKSILFLPALLEQSLNVVKINNEPITTQDTVLLPKPTITPSPFYTTPILILSLICVIIFLLSLIKNPLANALLKLSDFILFLSTGAIGILILFLWQFSSIAPTHANLMILWALPTNFFLAFLIFKKRRWVGYYFYIATYIYVLLLLFWAFLPQKFDLSLIPVTILLSIRCYHYKSLMSRYNKNATTLRW